MIQKFDRGYVESVLSTLDEHDCLFPQSALKKLNNELKLLGTGGFSSVYEMYNKERPERSYAMKVIGFQSHKVNSVGFRNASRIQWILSRESKYIMRILDAKELVLVFDENGTITEVKDATREVWKESEKTLHLQFVLMEKLDELIEKDRFANVKLLKEELSNEAEVLKFAFEIGQGLAAAHTNGCLHRDIKIENIFWDDTEKVYKLGDFGVAKWTGDGNAETIVYTDGYGAPEIERRLYDNYNATADIYSLGITLYLLLNDLRFPGSDGYYSKVEVQYHPEFIFPAPAHASEAMTRVIRKMCSYYSAERYQSMNEVLAELSMVLDSEGIEESDDLFKLADIATETFKEEKGKKSEEEPKKREQTRAERKEAQKLVDMLYSKDSTKYFFAITILLTLLFKGLQPDSSMVTNWMFFMLPAAVLIEALLQNIEEFHLAFGTIILVSAVFSIYSIGLTVPHIVLILCVLIGSPVLTLAGSTSAGLWILLEMTGKLRFLDNLIKWDIGWIILIVVSLVIYKYFRMRIKWAKTTYIRAFLSEYIYNKMFLLMTLAGIVLLILQKCNVIAIPKLVERMHFVRTGMISFAAMCIFEWWGEDYEEEFEKEERVMEEREGLTEDDELLD